MKGFLWWHNGKESACNAGAAGDVGLIPGWEDRGAWRVTVHMGVRHVWCELACMHAVSLEKADQVVLVSFLFVIRRQKKKEHLHRSYITGACSPRSWTWTTSRTYVENDVYPGSRFHFTGINKYISYMYVKVTTLRVLYLTVYLLIIVRCTQ